MTARPGSGPSPADDAGSPVDRIVERFGGIRPMAAKIDVPVTTVQGWKKRGAIPLARHGELRAAAQRHAIALDEADLEAATPAEERLAAQAQGQVQDQAQDQAVPPPTPETPAPVELAAEAATPEAGAAPGAARPAKPPPPPEPRPAVPHRRSGGGGFFAFLAFLMAGAALSQAWWTPLVPAWPKPPIPAPPPPDPGLVAQIRALAERVSRVERQAGAAAAEADVELKAVAGRLARLENQPPPSALPPAPLPAPPAPPQAAEDPRVAPLALRLEALERQFSGTQADSAALARDLTGLKRQVGALAERGSGVDEAVIGAQALVLATEQLRDQVAAGRAYAPVLAAVERLAGSEPEAARAIAALAPFAGKGVPRAADLAQRFEALARDIRRAGRPAGSGGGWAEEVTGVLSTLVTVRRQDGAVVGDTPDAVLARAEAAAKAGRLGPAVAELAKLEGPAAAAAAPWRAEAEARLAADQAVAALSERAVQLLSQASSSKGAK